MRLVVGVGGGIAAYKVCGLVRLFAESGHQVTVVPTESALKFVGAATWEALSGRPVSTSVFDDVASVAHVRIGKDADLIVVAPATADLLAKAAHGHAGDLLTATLLTARCPVVFAPAMHTEMWEHPATVANVETLRHRGARVIEPAYGRLTGADSGPGRLPDVDQIHTYCEDLLRFGSPQPSDLAGRRVVVSAGGTREHLDPVRYLGNSSSGKQGFALAETARARGAEVTLVAANVSLPDPAGVKVVRVVSTADLGEAISSAAAAVDAVVMAAAPADFRPAEPLSHKIKKQPGAAVPVLALVETVDVLAGLVAERDGAERPVLVGFAAETGDADATVLEHARAKLARKGCDLLVVNDVSGGAVFGADDNQVVIVSAAVGAEDVVVPRASKRAIAHAVWDQVAMLLQR